jgi:hypothetical protein
VEGDGDYDAINKAVGIIEQIGTFVNTGVHEKESIEKLLEVDSKIVYLKRTKKSLVRPSRKFIYEGDVKKIGRGSPDTRHLFLFNDVIILTKEQVFKDKYDFHTLITLYYSKLIKIDSPDSKMHLFMIMGLWRTYLFDAQTEEALKIWMDKISENIKILEV